ncbi:MAG: DUF805 domain-containing protein [Asticcacaulis sp.]
MSIGSGIPAADIVEVLGGGLSLFLFIPSLSVTCRRLHDSNRTAWWVVLGLPLMMVNLARVPDQHAARPFPAVRRLRLPVRPRPFWSSWF